MSDRSAQAAMIAITLLEEELECWKGTCQHLEDFIKELGAKNARLRASMDWVAARLKAWEPLLPERDQATCRELFHALVDSPKLKGG